MSRKMKLEDGVEEAVQYDFDLFVIGAGSGGVRSARTAAGFGAKVAICELPFHPISSETNGGVGGTCVLRGCVPKKILVYGASFSSEFEDSRNFGWNINGPITFDWKKLLENKTNEITRLNGVYKRMLANSGVTQLEGEAKFVEQHKVEVMQIDGTPKYYTAKHILIATGSRAARLNVPGKLCHEDVKDQLPPSQNHLREDNSALDMREEEETIQQACYGCGCTKFPSVK